jgi:uncharacterized membrane protein YhdT
MELAFCCCLNLYYGGYEGTWAMKLNYCVSWFFAVALGTCPITIPAFYLYNFHKLADEEFEEKWGAPYEGLRKDSRWSLFYPITFVVRRLAFAYLCVFMPGSLTIQLTV